jgi:hypothetical protein
MASGWIRRREAPQARLPRVLGGVSGRGRPRFDLSHSEWCGSLRRSGLVLDALITGQAPNSGRIRSHFAPREWVMRWPSDDIRTPKPALAVVPKQTGSSGPPLEARAAKRSSPQEEQDEASRYRGSQLKRPASAGRARLGRSVDAEGGGQVGVHSRSLSNLLTPALNYRSSKFSQFAAFASPSRGSTIA